MRDIVKKKVRKIPNFQREKDPSHFWNNLSQYPGKDRMKVLHITKAVKQPIKPWKIKNRLRGEPRIKSYTDFIDQAKIKYEWQLEIKNK